MPYLEMSEAGEREGRVSVSAPAPTCALVGGEMIALFVWGKYTVCRIDKRMLDFTPFETSSSCCWWVGGGFMRSAECGFYCPGGKGGVGRSSLGNERF